jgi:hypothetical protein
MQIHKENIQNLLVNMFLEKKNFKKNTNPKNTPFHASSLGNGPNKF